MGVGVGLLVDLRYQLVEPLDVTLQPYVLPRNLTW